jgi:cytochrome c5
MTTTKVTKITKSEHCFLRVLRVLRVLRDLRGYLLVLGSVAMIGVLSAFQQQATLPEGAGAEVVRARCLSCHEADLIVPQRLSRVGWEREIDKMVRWGAVVPAAERAPLLEYLSARFAPKPVISRPARTSDTQGTGSASGEATYARACLTCHEQDLIEQQRLTRAGWAREVDKMIRWGATVAETDKDALVDFLTATFGIP